MEQQKSLEELKRCFKLFKESNRKDSFLIDPVLLNVFNEAEKPYNHLLLLVQDLKEFEQSKSTSLTAYILKFFEEWKKDNKESQVIDKALKDEVLLTVCGRSTHQHFSNIFIKLFEIEKDDPQSYMSLIDDLVREQKYDVVSRIVAALKLTSRVSIFQFLIPLIAQGKVDVVEKYLDQAGDIVPLELMQYLDSCIESHLELIKDQRKKDQSKNDEKKKDQLTEKAKELGLDVSKCRENLLFSSLTNLVKRLMKRYKISEEQLPSYRRNRVQSTMRYLAQQCFKDGKTSLENFEELASNEVKDSKLLQTDLLRILLGYKQDELAFRMARNFGLPEPEWPWRLRNFRSPTNHSQTQLEELDTSRMFYKLPVPLSDVIFVDTTEKFNEFLIDLSKEEKIGVDAERLPSFEAKKSSVSLIQIATGTEKIYILDMDSLEKILSTDQRSDFVDLIYKEGLLVLGFGFKEDMNYLNAAFPSIYERYDKSNNILDLLQLWHTIQKHNPTILPYASNKSDTKGPSESVGQCSNVNIPALTEAQVTDDGNKSDSTVVGFFKQLFISKADTEKETSNCSQQPLTEAQIADDCKKSDTRGLSELVRQCFNVCLDKREQMSNWSKRPLRDTQIAYAAVDAYVLLKIHEFLSEELGPEALDDLVNKIQKGKKSLKGH